MVRKEMQPPKLPEEPKYMQIFSTNHKQDPLEVTIDPHEFVDQLKQRGLRLTELQITDPTYPSMEEADIIDSKGRKVGSVYIFSDDNQTNSA